MVCIPNYLLSRTVAPVALLITNRKANNTTLQAEIIYGVVNNFIGVNYYAQIFLFILSLSRGFVLYNLLFIISLIVIYKFRKHLVAKSIVTHNTREQHHSDSNKHKHHNHDDDKSDHDHHHSHQEPTKKQKKETRVTKMVLSMSLNYIIGNFLASLSPILFQTGVNSTFYGFYGSVSNIVSYLSHGSYFFLYYIFNTTFKKNFLEIFCLKSLTKTGGSKSHVKSHPLW